MVKIKKLISMILGVVLYFTMAISIVGCENTNNDNETVTVTDMLGEQVTVKKNPEKVACTSRTTYDLLIAFGVADSIDGVYYSLLENEWSSVFDTKADERYSLAYQESYETYIARGVDIVFSPEKGLYMNLTFFITTPPKQITKLHYIINSKYCRGQ